MKIIQFLMLLTFLLLSHRKFKIKPLLIFGVRGKQNKAIVHISTKEVKSFDFHENKILISI